MTQQATLEHTSHSNESNISKSLLRRRVEATRDETEPNYRDFSNDLEDDANDSNIPVPPILRKTQSVLSSSDIPQKNPQKKHKREPL